MNPAIEIYQILVEDSTYEVIKRSAVVLEEGGAEGLGKAEGEVVWDAGEGRE